MGSMIYCVEILVTHMCLYLSATNSHQLQRIKEHLFSTGEIYPTVSLLCNYRALVYSHSQLFPLQKKKKRGKAWYKLSCAMMHIRQWTDIPMHSTHMHTHYLHANVSINLASISMCMAVMV